MVLGMCYCLLKKSMQTYFSTQYNILACGLMCQKLDGGTKAILLGQGAQMQTGTAWVQPAWSEGCGSSSVPLKKIWVMQETQISGGRAALGSSIPRSTTQTKINSSLNDTGLCPNSHASKSPKQHVNSTHFSYKTLKQTLHQNCSTAVKTA